MAETRNPRRRGLTGLMAALVAVTVAAGGVGFAQQSPGARIDLKVLLITADSGSSFDAWVDLLHREQVPYATFDTTARALTDQDLRSGDRAFYQGVVCSTGCAEILTNAELAVLDAFQADFGIRRVNGYVRPGAGYGLAPSSTSGFLNSQVGQLTAAGAEVFPYLRGPVTPQKWTWGYGAAPLPGSGHRTLVEGPGGTSWVGLIANPAGFEEMVVTIDSDSGAFHSLLLGHGQLAWVTKGVYLGYSRNYFSAHFDDIFLSSDRWDVDDNVTYHDGGVRNPLIRMSAGDAQRAIDWTRQTGVRLEMAFNGEGSERAVAAHGSDPLTEVLVADKDLFGWINHTYEHSDLDDATTDEVRAEIIRNVEFAAAHGIPFDPTELVTGRHSGLSNPAVHSVLGELGIEWVAANRSTIPQPIAVGPATAVPRHGSSLYYNIATSAEMLDQFNYITYENCNPTRRQCRTSPATWDQIVGWEAEIMLGHILGNRPEPHFLHQGNLAEDGTFFLVFGPALEKYRSHLAVELVQPEMSEAGRYLLRAKRWDAARPGVTGYLQGGAIHLISPVGVQVPITGLPGGEDYDGLPSGWVSLDPGVERIIPIGSGPVDLVAPVISVLGDDPLLVPVGGPFNDPGATASDDIDGDLTAAVVTDASAVDVAVPGTYQVTYSVTDTAGNPAAASRTVEVIATPGTGGTIEVRITNGADDVEERGDGTLEFGSGDLELVEENTIQVVGLRFTGLDIPRGARITAAWVQFTVDEATGRTTNLTFGAHDIGDAPAFWGRGDLRARPLGAATVTWQPPRWAAVGQSGPAQQTPDLTPVIQQIIDRPDWAPGNTIALIIKGEGKRIAESHEGSPTGAPLLHIEYTTVAAGNAAPVVTASGSGVTAPGEAALAGTVADDGFPDPPAAVTVLWEQTAGPAAAAITDPASPATTVLLPEPGDYTFTLTATDGELSASATVTVTATVPTVDLVAPVITVLGADPLLVPVGGPFNDPGATALDDIDGDLTAAVITDASAVDVAVPGTYQVTYTVTDTAGNQATGSRTVEVTPLPVGGVIEVRIATGADDVEERGDGTLEIGSGDLELVEENTLQVVGLQFVGIDIPPGARITAAWVQFTVDEPTGRSTNLTFGAHDTANAPPFAGKGDLRARPLGPATVAWQPARWVAAGDAGPAQQTPDLAAVIQQIIDRTDWTPGNAIALIIRGEGKRIAESYEGSPTGAPLLHIEYTLG